MQADPTTEQIEALAEEARAAGDDVMATYCAAALAGSWRAVEVCGDVITAARTAAGRTARLGGE